MNGMDYGGIRECGIEQRKGYAGRPQEVLCCVTRSKYETDLKITIII